MVQLEMKVKIDQQKVSLKVNFQNSPTENSISPLKPSKIKPPIEDFFYTIGCLPPHPPPTFYDYDVFERCFKQHYQSTLTFLNTRPGHSMRYVVNV